MAVTLGGNRAKLSKILKNAYPGALLSKGHTETVLAMARLIPRFAKCASMPEARVLVRRHGKFNVKIFLLVTTAHSIIMQIGILASAGVDSTKLKPKTNRSLVMQVCRELIADQITSFNNKFWEDTKHMKPGPKCEVSNRSLRANKTAVDHVYPFKLLVENWAKLLSLNIEQIKVTRSRKLKRLTMGEAMDKNWAEYHRANAKLRVITAKANLSKGAKLETETTLL